MVVIKVIFEGEDTKKLTVDAEGDLCIWQHFLTFLSTDSKIHLVRMLSLQHDAFKP